MDQWGVGEKPTFLHFLEALLEGSRFDLWLLEAGVLAFPLRKGLQTAHGGKLHSWLFLSSHLQLPWPSTATFLIVSLHPLFHLFVCSFIHSFIKYSASIYFVHILM